MNYNNYYMPYMNISETGYSQANMEEMYPDIYKRMYPHVKNIVNEVKSEYQVNFTLSNEVLDSMCNEVVNRSGLYMDMDEPYLYDNDTTVEAVTYVGRRRDEFGRRDFRRDGFRRGGSIFRDIARILLLRELFGRF